MPTLATRATGDGPLELLGDAPQLTQALPDVRKVMPCQLINVAAGQCGIVGQPQETSDLLQTEAELATTPAASIALVANLACFFLLMRFRDQDINLRSVWLCSRNDVFSNAGVIAAAGAVAWLGQG